VGHVCLYDDDQTAEKETGKIWKVVITVYRAWIMGGVLK